MKIKQILFGAATAIGLFGTTVSTMAANPSPREWVVAICAALGAGVMAAINPQQPIKNQFKKGKIQ